MTKVNLQDMFLEQAKNNHTPVTIHLVAKARLVGIVTDYDQHSITVNSYGQEQHIYKQAISTIVLPRGHSTRMMFGDNAGESRPPRPSRPRGGPRYARPPRRGETDTN